MRVSQQPRRVLVFRKLAGAFFAITALMVQPIVGINVPSVFAATSNITQLAFTTPERRVEQQQATSIMTVQTQNAAGASESLTTSSTKLLLRTTSATGEFSANGTSGWAHEQTATMASGSANKSFYYRDTTAGTPTVTATATDSAGVPYAWKPATQTVTVTAPPTPTLEENMVCASGCEYTNLADAVAGEAAGQTITIKAGETVTQTTNVVVGKSLTIVGQDGATIKTTGSTPLLTVTANDVTLRHITIEKTDTVSQDLINIQGSNVTVSDSVFTAKYTLAANDHTVRALTLSGGADNVAIQGNRFTNVRQPAYINNGATGTIRDNYADQTRGWVIEKASNMTLAGNTWGTNAVDIAIIPGVSPETNSNNYTCRLAQLKADNNTTKIDDQYPASYCAITPGPTQNYVIHDSTTQLENEKGAWWFNRDTSTASPYVMSGAQASGGIGSLYVAPIGANASDKFIAEYYVDEPLDNTGKIAFDYYVGADGPANSADFIYANLYINVSDNGNYGNCVYTYGARAGSGWQTLTIAPNTEASSVRTRAGSPQTCPLRPSDLPASAHMRAFVVNVGDTSSNDVGMSAYLDKVSIETVAETAVYDFEPIRPAAPTDLSWNNATCSEMTNIAAATARWSSVSGADSYVYSVQAPGSDWAELPATNTSTPQVLDRDGVWKFRVASIKNDTRSLWSGECVLTYDGTPPSVVLNPPVKNTDGTVTFSGTADGAKTVVLTVNDSSVDVAVKADGTWSFTSPGKVVSGQTYAVSVVAVDAAGNRSVPQATVVLGDPITPIVPVPSVNGSGGVIGTSEPVTLGTIGSLPTQQAVASFDRLAAAAAEATVSAADSANAANTNDDTDGAILGATDTTPQSQGRSEMAVTPSAQGWKIFGIVWYWWLLAFAAFAVVWWLIAAWRRRRLADDPSAGL